MKIFWSDVALRFWFCGWWIVTSVVYKVVWMYVSVLSIEEEKTEALLCISLSLLQKRINHEVSVVFFKRIVTVLFSSVQLLSCVQLFATPWAAACQASMSITNSWSLLKLMSIESVMPSKHLILCHPLLLQPSIFSSVRVFFNDSVICFKWPKYWSFSFSISPSNEYSGLISFRMDWLDLLAVQGTLKNLLQQHSSKASILWHSAFVTVQLSHSYMIMGTL